MKLFLKFIFFILFLHSLSLAQTSIFNRTKVNHYKNHLIETHDYYRAITETYRLYFDEKQNPNILNYELGKIYFLGQNYNLSRNFLYKFIDQQSHINKMTKESKKILFLSYYKETDWRNALLELQDFDTFQLSSKEKIALSLKSAELYTKIFNIHRAEKILSQITNTEPFAKTNITFLSTKIKEAQHLPYKNKTLSMILAIIPGMNLIYCHQYKQGIIAFLTQTVATGLSYYSFKRGDWVTGLVVASTTFGWYTYNFKRSNLVVAQYNDKIKNQFQTSFSIPFN